MMNYEQALSYIESIEKFGIDLGLDRMKELMRRLGDPQDRLKFVHVAGTNGKGSTVAFISNILMAAGYKTGIYISPSLDRFTKRIQVDGKEIDKEVLALLTQKVKDAADSMVSDGLSMPTEFEQVNAIAFLYYEHEKCDFVVLEVGLGGRIDSTNVIKTPEAAVIASISFDHMQYLGNTLPEIAGEKAGIMKEGGDVVVYDQAPEVMEVFRNVSKERGCRLFISGKPLNDKALKYDLTGQYFEYDFDPSSIENGKNTALNKEIKETYQISLLGDYQIRNASLAITAALVLQSKGYEKITDTAIKEGLINTKWEGRFELLQDNPKVIVDGAHNPDGIKVLCSSLKRLFPDKKIMFIAGVLADKDYKSMMKEIAPLGKIFYTITPPNNRALSARELADTFRSFGAEAMDFDSVEDALNKALLDAESDDVICAFGSLYYIGQIRKLILKDV
ncbi:bifunctional folylpolyglutamate synthase/dihydrofolate synthase [Butyrivibrio sp.]|uniref:bifunctional folylpolyglutamate synthase/dihydrofolate synthase n=1 Tax=Butyrivibrio sp. TaxID=28121 RepID=UPI0025CD21FC|nr:folylpolyglutamate synthase/dihydrofolate synthase family protein [Butyrivibrio sp.]